MVVKVKFVLEHHTQHGRLCNFKMTGGVYQLGILGGRSVHPYSKFQGCSPVIRPWRWRPRVVWLSVVQIPLLITCFVICDAHVRSTINIKYTHNVPTIQCYKDILKYTYGHKNIPGIPFTHVRKHIRCIQRQAQKLRLIKTKVKEVRRFQHLRTSLTLVFIKRGFYSSNNVVRCMAKLFSISDEFRLLCTKVGIPPHRIDVTSIHVLRCSVYKNFALIWLCFYSFKSTVLHVHVFFLFLFSLLCIVSISLYRSGE